MAQRRLGPHPAVLLSLLAAAHLCAASSRLPSSSAGGSAGRPERQRQLLQAPSAAPGGPPTLLGALQSIGAEFSGAGSNAMAPNATSPSLSPPSPGGPGPCTDPALLVNTMSTFCKVSSVDALAALQQEAVQACCRLTSATLQRGCWDPCSPPPAVSQDVLVVVKLWRTICLINIPVTCDEGAVAAQGSGR